MKSRWISWREHQILFQDFSGNESDLDALRAEVAAVDQLILRQPLGSIIALADVTNTVASASAMQLFKSSAAQTKPFIARQALIGVHGMKRYLAQSVARFAGQPMKVFETRDEAFDWLVER